MRKYRSNLGLLLLCTCVFVGMSLGKIAHAQDDSVSEEAPATEETEATEEAATEGPEAGPQEAEAEALVEQSSDDDLETPPEDVEEIKTEETAKKDEVEEIVVTGSRIRSAIDKPAPILDISGEDIDRTGLTSISDLLMHLPVSGGALNTRFNNSGNFGFPPDGGGIGAGAAQADLRYLGSNRVLVLVDGQRWVNGASASGVASATDLNTIPLGIIDRVEVLEDGASAIYGSDAIAGVVNIITKKDFDGFDASAYVGGYHYGDGLTQEYDLTWGNVTEKASIVLDVSFTKQDPIWAKDRDISKAALPYADPECMARCSSGTPQGRFFFIDPRTGSVVNTTINDGVDGVPQFDYQNPYSLDFHEFTNDDRFNYAPYNMVLTPSQRIGVFSQMTYKLAEPISMHAKALFNNRRSKNQAAPEPLFVGSEAGNGNRMDTISVDVAQPYNPFGITLDAQNMVYFIGRRPLEAGPRKYEQNVNTFYVSGGFNGGFQITDKWFYWDITALYSVNRADQMKHGAFNSSKIQTALGPPDICAADPKCVPLNLFGGQGSDGNGTITPEMLEYIGFVQKDVSQQELFDLSANITGKLFDLPGGAVGLAVGGEYRHLEGYFVPDAVVTAGDTAGVPSTPTSGEYDVTEGYAELLLPLVEDVPGLYLLDVTGAVRLSNYSTFGTTTNFKVGGRWKPIEDLMLRGSFSQGFRAPGIGELFGSAARYDAALDDPCNDYKGLSDPANEKSPEIQASCEALGVPDTYLQPNPQIGVTTGGNRDLEPETSKGISATVVFSPSFLTAGSSWAEQLDLEVGYYWLKLDDAISAVDATVQLARCVSAGDPNDFWCKGISRTAGGAINGFSNQLVNIGSIKTDGIDISLLYTSPNTAAGRFRIIALSAILLHFTKTVPSSDVDFIDLNQEGSELGDPERAFPKFKQTLTLGWAGGDFGAAVTGRYIHSVRERCEGDEMVGLHTDENGNVIDGPCSDFILDPQTPFEEDPEKASHNVLDPTIYLDLQLSWFPTALNDTLGLTIGVNNILNTDPPACLTCQLNGFDATTYDVPGIFPYARLNFRM